MKSKILGLLALGLLTAPLAANAVILDVSESATLNFDLSAATPSPPYTLINVTWSSVGPCCIQYASELFADLDAGGAPLASAAVGLIAAWPTDPFPGTADGVFSIRVTAVRGPGEIDACARGSDGSILSECVPATVSRVVPEPATLALLGLGLAGLGLSRRRRTN